MKKYKQPKMTIKTFERECVLTESGVATIQELQEWEKKNQARIIHLDYTKDLLQFKTQ